MASADGSILIRTKVDTSGVKKGTNAIQNGVGKINNSLLKLGGTIAAVFSVYKLVEFGKTAIDVASKMTNAMIGLQSIVEGTGNSFEQATNFIDAYISDGLVPATNAVTAYKNLLMRGYTTEQIEKVMIALKDSAAFGRQASLSLGDAVQSATEGLKNENSILVDNAGVTKNVSKMWEDYAASIGTTAKALTKQQKIQAEVNGIMTETRFQTGDAAKVANTWSGQIAMLNAKWQQFMAIVGNGLIKVLTPVVKVLNNILTSVISVGNAIAKVFGWETSIESITASTASNVEDAAASQTDLGSSAKETNKALKKQLAFFDDINVLASESASAGAGAGTTGVSGGVIAGDVEEKTKEMSELEKRLKRIQDLFKEGFDIGFRTDGLEKIEKNIKSIRESLIKIWSDPELQKSMNKFSKSAIKTLGTIVGSATSQGVSIGVGITGGIEKAVSNPSFQKFASEKLSGVFDGLTQISDDVAELAVAFAELGKAFESDGFQEIISFFTKLNTYVNLTFLDSLVGLIGDLFSYFTSPIRGNGDKWGELLENILTILGNLLEPMEQFLDMIMGNSKNYDESSFHKFMQDITAVRSGQWGDALDGINKFLGKWVEVTDKTHETDFTKPFVDLNTWFNTEGDMVRQWFEGSIAPLFTTEQWQELGQGMLYGIGAKWDEFLEWWESTGIPTWFEEGVAPWFTVEKWKELGKNMQDGMKAGFNGIVGWIVGILNKIIGSFESMLNFIVDGANELVDKFNSLPSAVRLGYTASRFDKVDFGNIPIPKLAQGAVLPPNKPFMSIVGDQKNGTNIEAPLETIKQALAEVMANYNSGGNGNIIFKIGETEVARTLLAPLLNEMSRQGLDTEVLGVV